MGVRHWALNIDGLSKNKKKMTPVVDNEPVVDYFSENYDF